MVTGVGAFVGITDMVTVALSPAVNAKPVQSSATLSDANSLRHSGQSIAQGSSGETSSANIRMDTLQPVTAAEQSSAIAHLRDQETAEHLRNGIVAKDAPTGPPPAFDETPLERQIRIAFQPPEVADAKTIADKGTSQDFDDQPDDTLTVPPSPAERAETAVAETRAISEPTQSGALDVKG